MSTFAFRAVDLAGVAARGEMDASSKSVVSDHLRQRGLIVLDISEKRESLKVESILQRFKSVNLRALAVFSRQFATLIASGMPMLRCLYTLEQQTQDEMLRSAIIASEILLNGPSTENPSSSKDSRSAMATSRPTPPRSIARTTSSRSSRLWTAAPSITTSGSSPAD